MSTYSERSAGIQADTIFIGSGYTVELFVLPPPSLSLS